MIAKLCIYIVNICSCHLHYSNIFIVLSIFR